MRFRFPLSAVFLMLLFLMMGCSKDSDDEKNKNVLSEEKVEEKSAEYYVKYSFTCGNPTYFCSFKINFTNEKLQNMTKSYGDDTTNSHGARSYSDEIICGPFESGADVELRVTNEHNVTNRLLEISVSKNNSPFAIKVSENSSHITYRIE